jgi:hypothetical protein
VLDREEIDLAGLRIEAGLQVLVGLVVLAGGGENGVFNGRVSASIPFSLASASIVCINGFCIAVAIYWSILPAIRPAAT